MSQSGISYSLDQSLSANRLMVFYDFSGMSGRHIGSTAPYGGGFNFGVIENCDPSINTGVYSGIVCGFGSSVAAGKDFTTGTFLKGNKANLTGSNIRVTGTKDLPYSNCSVLFDLEFNEKVTDCILFGSLEKTSHRVGKEIITGAKGYNFGITNRGHLFYQGFDGKGDFIYSADSIELAQRNVLGFSLSTDSLSLLRFDYLNHKIQKQDFFVNTSFIANNTGFYLGGSPQYFRGGAYGSSGEFETSDVSLNSFCFLSGALAPSTLFRVGSGMIGNYSESSSALITQRRITGYNQTTLYKTGITGYDYKDTGDLTISTGRYMMTGNITSNGTSTLEEGENYFIYYTFDSALSDKGIKTFNKRQIGYLHPDSGYQYLPTGEQAFSTLGLQNVEGAVDKYIEQQGFSGAGTIAVEMFTSRFQTGYLSVVSGVKQTPAYETVTAHPSIPTSGIDLGGLSNEFKKNFIYYLGDRP